MTQSRETYGGVIAKHMGANLGLLTLGRFTLPGMTVSLGFGVPFAQRGPDPVPRRWRSEERGGDSFVAPDSSTIAS